MFLNLLHKVLLMTGFLEVDTVRALFPTPHPLPEALGLSLEGQMPHWLPQWVWASQVSCATLLGTHSVLREKPMTGHKEAHTERKGWLSH